MMPTHPSLQRAARERITGGKLPRVCCDSIWGGYGRGDLCSLCDKPIRSNEVEFEVPEVADSAGAALKFHIPCYAVWQLECAHDDAKQSVNVEMQLDT
jgi:hypothetical protein